MRLHLRGVRVIDPAIDLDVSNRDVWIEDGRLIAVDHGPPGDDAAPIDLTPRTGEPECVLCPGFIDLHAHLREPGADDAETVLSGAAAAAAGGFTTVVAMANTRPPIDSPRRLQAAMRRNAEAQVQVLQVAAISRGLSGHRLTDVDGCLAAGAVAVGDDGRNAAHAPLLEQAIRAAARHERPVFVHPEDEEAIARRAGHGAHLPVVAVRPPETEVRAVQSAIAALERAATGRLHLQHLSTEGAVDVLRQARERGVAVTAEVTPHHLTMQQSAMLPDDPLRKVNPPIREADCVEAVRAALVAGVIDAIATDHAPHRASDKRLPYERAAPGMIGLETALPQLLSVPEFDGLALPRVIAALTIGPHRVLRDDRVAVPRLGIDEPATATLFDPGAEWDVTEATLRSRSRNTPLFGTRVRGRVLLTIASGTVVYADHDRLAPRMAVVHG